MYSPKLAPPPPALRTFQRYREMDSLSAYYHRSKRPEVCGIHEHDCPLFTLLLQGRIQPVAENYHPEETGPCSLIVTPKGMRHRDVISTPYLMTFCFGFKEALVEEMSEYTDVLTRPGIYRSGAVISAALRLQQETWGNDTAAPMVMHGLVYQLVGEMQRAQDKPKDNGAPPWLRAACEQLHDRCFDNVSIEQIASDVGVHRAHLSRTFRAFIGQTPGEYLRRIRIERVSKQLAISRRPLKEIAKEAGFSDQAHFSREFRKEMGMTPLEFRRSTNPV